MVTQPFVLISQAPRSGGTMLMRLLDGHPELWSIPHEWGTPFLTDLPADPWPVLYDAKTEGRARDGFRQAKRKLTGDRSVYPFELDTAAMEQAFRKLAADASGTRQIYDAFLTAYFEAWGNYRNPHGDKKWVTGFAPRLILSARSLQAFNKVYPDGRVISLVRDPATWYASASRWSPEWADLDDAIDYWTRAAAKTAKSKRLIGDRMMVVPFERLVNETEQQMRHIAAWLGIPYRDSLVEPTFNGEPVKPNSSYPADTTGITSEPARRGELLTDDERERIAQLTGDRYQQLVG